MSFSKQPTFANKVFADEVSSADHKKLCNLLEMILAWAVSDEVHKLCKERCYGCEVDHPSQRRHDCLMLTIEEKWITYGLEAIERVNSKRMIWRLFLEALRILKLECHNSIVDHLRDLERDPDSAMVYSLMELHLDTDNTEFDSILNYLSYWKEDKGY
jgi:hypothetical protein